MQESVLKHGSVPLTLSQSSSRTSGVPAKAHSPAGSATRGCLTSSGTSERVEEVPYRACRRAVVIRLRCQEALHNLGLNCQT